MASFSSLPELATQARNTPGEHSSRADKDGSGFDGKQIAMDREEKDPKYWSGQHTIAEQDHTGLGTTLGSPQRGHGFAGDVSKRKNRKRTLWITGVTVLLLATALGVGLGVGLNSSSNSAAPDQGHSTNDSSLAAGPATGKGRFPGSGFGILPNLHAVDLTTGESLGDFSPDNVLTFFQHHTGQIRWMTRLGTGEWLGGSNSSVVATDAKLGTPIGLMSTSTLFTQWHVFYVGVNNKLRQRYMDNNTRIWTDGPLNELDVSVFDSPHIGLRACFYRGPIENYDSTDLTGTTINSGIRLWVATSSTTFAQYAWRSPMAQWIYEQEWRDVDGRAGPACQGWGIGWTTYVVFVGLDSKISPYWRDTELGGQAENTEQHPLNTWQPVSTDFPEVDPTCGLTYSWAANLWARTLDSGQLQGWNMTFNAENTTTRDTLLSNNDGSTIAPGSELSASSVNPHVSGGENDVYLLYTGGGDDLTMSIGSSINGEWQPDESVPIPDE